VATENAKWRRPKKARTTTENTTAPPERRRGPAPVALPAPYAAVLDDYTATLESAPLSDQTRRTYTSKVRQFLAWLAGTDLDENPLTSADGRDWGRARLPHPPPSRPQTQPRDHQQRARRRRRPLHPPRPRARQRRPRRGFRRGASRARPTRPAALPPGSPALPPSPRDQALALVPFYAGARISEIVALDVDDIARSARKGVLRILGKGERVRHVPIHPQLRTALTGWLDERNDWPGANDNPALFLNQRGQRLSVRGAHDIVTAIAAAAGLDDHPTVHVLRHTFATTLVRGGTDLVIVAELLGHARLETTRGYTRPSAEDRTRALDLLLVDK